MPFLWAAVWAAIAIPWVQRDMHRERVAWELDKMIPEDKLPIPKAPVRGEEEVAKDNHPETEPIPGEKDIESTADPKEDLEGVAPG